MRRGIGALLATALAATPGAVAAEPADDRADEQAATSEEPGPRTAIHLAILRVEGVPWEDVHEALAPRLPGVELLPFADASFERTGGQLFAYIEVVVDPDPGAQARLTIVLSDQRAYSRQVVPEASRPLRSIVTTVANTIAAIEQEQIEADEQQVEIPRPEAEATEPEPAPAEPEITEPTPPPVDEAPVEPAPTPEPGPPRFELGLSAALQPTFGLAPSAVRGFAALGGEGRVGLRHRSGAVVELGLRIAGRSAEGHRLWRNRLHLAGGYAWRARRFTVAAVLGPTVEPWVVRLDGAAQPTRAGHASTRATPLWGVAAAVTPGLRWQVARTVGLRLGLRTELATSVLSSGASVRLLAVDPPTPGAARPVLFGLGGVELSTALELTVWIAPPPDR